MRRAILIFTLATTSAVGQEEKSPLTGPMVLLWPQGAPLAQGEGEKDKPSLSVYLAPEAKATGAAVVVCPGGGYARLAKGHEGHDVAVHLNGLGVSAFVLSYRLGPKYNHPCPMLDVQRAIRTVRARAEEWKVDRARVGVMGFSAGGHLATTVMTHFDDGRPDAEDPIEKMGCRPDLAILVYPYIALDKPYTHQGAKKNLLGDRVNDPALAEELSAQNRVTAGTPPAFMVHTSQDTTVPPEHSIELYLAMRRARIPAELHIYERGAHGWGLAPKDPVLSTWPERLAAWLGVRGFLTRP